MRFLVLGSVEAWMTPHHKVALSGSKLRTALAALVLARGRVVPDSRLSALLWGEDPPATSAAQIQTYMSRLRQLLLDHAEVVRQRPGYLLRVPDGTREAGTWDTDVAEFEHFAARGRDAQAAGDADSAAHLLHRALAVWRGPVLGGVTEFLAEAERGRLEEMRLTVLERRIEADFALGRHGELVSELIGLTASYPLREQLCGQLMTALYRCGRQADALTVYQECRRTLTDELGIDPTPSLQRLYQSILVAAPVLATPTTAPRSEEARPARTAPAELPPALPDFTGREQEVIRLRTQLAGRQRAGTPAVGVVVGMPGVGKTSLALHVAHQLVDDYSDGQLWVDLRGTSTTPLEPVDALADLLRAMGVDSRDIPAGLAERTRLYRSTLADRRCLIVLDDAAGAWQLRPLVPAAPGCGVLVTGRTQLTALEGVRPIRLGTFTRSEATALLRSTVGEERIGADPQSAEELAEACGGLPLAVRIAGSRLAARPHWTPRGLADRLNDPRRGLDELCLADLRVRDAMEASYRRLTEPARRALLVLARPDVPAFSARTASLLLDLPLEAAQDLVELLVDDHLLQPVDGDNRGFRMHRLVRAFGLEQAARCEPGHEQHAALDRTGRPHPRLVSGRGEVA
ncbi:AfsR/SARP family transcriptional regulator [Streptomyces phaeochromogenes]|uniref:AfsR/SARP family transcriptional regulator n=1 Tax=Streptomyces phaeochromogenes TaxID=1923 RepID=UPI002E14E3BC|nr:NB-ARC domain-containing protein [Streptomyces phaeochromogenes]